MFSLSLFATQQSTTLWKYVILCLVLNGRKSSATPPICMQQPTILLFNFHGLFDDNNSTHEINFIILSSKLK